MRGLALLAIVLFVPALATAAEWSNVEPGVSTMDQVRDRFGPPTKEAKLKVEGYDTTEWIYEGDQAPLGLVRATVDFGILFPGGYKPTTVRLLKLEPKQFIFGRQTVVQGWGIPDGVGDREGVKTFFYRDGLIVLFDSSGEVATTLIFSLPQPDAVTPSAPAAPTGSSSQPKPAPPKQ
jgi:hypothetical protein